MKSLSILLAIGMILSSVATIGMEKSNYTSKNNNIFTDSQTISIPQIVDAGKYINIFAENANYMHDAGKPMLPYYTKIYYFPLGTKISIKCQPVGIKEIEISGKIMPAPSPQPYGYAIRDIKEDESVYESNNEYPSTWYSYSLGGGLHKGQHVTILSLHLYPYRYNAVENKIKYASNFNVKISYEKGKNIFDNDAYDLLIIAPSQFKDALQPLVDEKEEHGIKTILMAVEDIYSSYNGHDNAEKVKYCIKDAIEQWGIKYVLLVGGKKSYITGNWGYDGPTKVDDSLWYVPVRYVALNDMAEAGYISDLYFADIYDANGSFSSWDTNGNNIFGEWRFQGKDKMDFYPDVYVGRLACRSVKEVQNVVNKIVEYENTAYGQPWFNRMLIMGGDTFDDPEKICEGEVSTLWFYEHYMSNFEKTSLFVSDGTLPFQGKDTKMGGEFAWINTIKTMNNGYGFVAMDGHGSPTVWATHFKGHASHNDLWVNALMTYNMDLLKNKGMYPVVVIGGCHNSEFNISLMDFIKNEWTYQPTYECFGWHLVKMADKGAIATLGNTALGYGADGRDKNGNGIPDCVEYNGGYIEDRFFEAYGNEGKHILGAAWGTAIQNYINTYPPLQGQIDAKTIEEWALLGDPSLMIGGYS